MEGWVDPGTAISVVNVQPMPKAICHSGCCEKKTTAPVGYDPGIPHTAVMYAKGRPMTEATMSTTAVTYQFSCKVQLLLVTVQPLFMNDENVQPLVNNSYNLICDK